MGAIKGGRGTRGRKPTNKDEDQNDQMRGHVKKTYKLSNVAELPTFIGMNQGVATGSNSNDTSPGHRRSPRGPAKKDPPSPPLPKRRRAPKRFKSPDNRITVPEHVKAMDLVLNRILVGRKDLPDSKKAECDNALGTIVRIWSSANCKDFPEAHPHDGGSIPSREREEGMIKEQLEPQNTNGELTAKLNYWKLQAEEMASRNQEAESKARELAANLEYWKSRAEEMTKQKLESDKRAMDLEADLKYWKAKAKELEREEPEDGEIGDLMETGESSHSDSGSTYYSAIESPTGSSVKPDLSSSRSIPAMGESSSQREIEKDNNRTRFGASKNDREPILIDISSDSESSSETNEDMHSCCDSPVKITNPENATGNGNPSSPHLPSTSTKGASAALDSEAGMSGNGGNIKAESSDKNKNDEDSIWYMFGPPKDYRTPIVIDLASDSDSSSESNEHMSPSSSPEKDEFRSTEKDPSPKSNLPPSTSTRRRRALNRTSRLEENEDNVGIATQLLDKCSLKKRLQKKDKIPPVGGKPVKGKAKGRATRKDDVNAFKKRKK